MITTTRSAKFFVPLPAPPAPPIKVTLTGCDCRVYSANVEELEGERCGDGVNVSLDCHPCGSYILKYIDNEKTLDYTVHVQY